MTTRKKAAKRPKPRNPVAKALRAAPFKQRVVKDKKKGLKLPKWLYNPNAD